MSDLVAYEMVDGIATVRLDDGKVNAQSPAMLRELSSALDRAEAEATVVVLTGREQVFSAGFDLKVFTETPELLGEMITLGARLGERLLGFPKPVIAAVNGNAIAAGAFLTLTTDVRIGVEGPFKLGLNEAKIGMTIPYAFIEMGRHRLAPAQFDRAIGTAEMYSPAEAVEAGFLDWVVAPERLGAEVQATAVELAGLNAEAHAAMKLRVRGPVIEAVRRAIDSELDPSVSF